MKIPQYFAQELPRVPDVSAQAAAMPHEAGAQFGEALANISGKFLQIEMNIARQKKELDFINRRDISLEEYDRDMLKKKLELEKLPDKSDYKSLMLEESRRKVGDILSRFERPEEAQKIRALLQQKHLITEQKALVDDNKFFLDKALGEAELLFERKIEELKKAESDEERILKKVEAEAVVKDRAKYFGEKWVAEKVIKLEDTERDARRKINLSNAIIEINNGKFNPNDVEELIKKYDIPPDRRPALYEHARIMRNEFQAQQDKIKTLQLYNDLSSMFTDVKDIPEVYFNAMRKQLSDPQYLASKGATLEQGRRTIEFIENEAIYYEKERLRGYNATQDKLLLKLQEGKLTSEDIKNSDLPATGLAQGDKAWFYAMLERRKHDFDPFARSDSEVYANVFQGILKEPGKWNKDRILKLIGQKKPDGTPGGLSIQDAIKAYSLWDKLTEKPAPLLSKKYNALQQAVSRLDEYRKAFMFVEKKDKVTREDAILNDRLHHKALEDLQDKVESGQDPFSALTEIMKPYVTEKSKGFFERLLSPVTMEDKGTGLIRFKKYKDAEGNEAVYLGGGIGRITASEDKKKIGKLVEFETK